MRLRCQHCASCKHAAVESAASPRAETSELSATAVYCLRHLPVELALVFHVVAAIEEDHDHVGGRFFE